MRYAHRKTPGRSHAARTAHPTIVGRLLSVAGLLMLLAGVPVLLVGSHVSPPMQELAASGHASAVVGSRTKRFAW